MMKARTLLTVAAAFIAGHAAPAAALESMSASTAYRRITVDGTGFLRALACPPRRHRVLGRLPGVL